MENELVIDVNEENISIAMLAEKRLIEYNSVAKDFSYAVGDIYLGKVKKIMPSLNAAFVNVGSERDAFIHYLDLGERFITINKFSQHVLSGGKPDKMYPNLKLEKELPKEGSIADYLQVGQEMMVQIAKEPISTKGPRLTTEISIAGRYLVLIPYSEQISVSQKIKSKAERNRLRQLMLSVKPKNFGLIIRTVAEGKMVAELDGELRVLLKRWNEALSKMRKNNSPKLLLNELDRSVSILRDSFNPDFQAVYVNDETTFNELKDYVTLIAPEKKNIVKLYDSDLPIFDAFNVTRQLKASMGRIVPMKNGAYLVIEHTEALHVIDVNSGNRFKKGEGQEGNALEVNLLAAEEIAHQLRLRDMGGIIVVDFIDMEDAAHRQMLYEKMREFMAEDKARHNILQLSKFGLMQITRHRVRPVMDMKTEEVCPTCMGKGVCQPSILFAESLADKIGFLMKTQGYKKLVLHVHPYVYAYINQGLVSLKMKWRWQFGFGLKIYSAQSMSFLQYKFYGPDKKEINLEDEEMTID